MPYIPDLDPDPNPGLRDAIQRGMDEPYHEYWYHLGRFIHTFAQTEFQLLLLLGKLSGLTKVKAGVIFHGTRAEGARDLINSLLKAGNNITQIQRLENPFGQMATIGTVRNNLVHWGANATSQGTFTVSNKERLPLKPKEYPISIEHFKQMCNDLKLISTIFFAEIEGILPHTRSGFWQPAWQYKLPPPSPRANKKDRGRPKERHQPPS